MNDTQRLIKIMFEICKERDRIIAKELDGRLWKDRVGETTEEAQNRDWFEGMVAGLDTAKEIIETIVLPQLLFDK